MTGGTPSMLSACLPPRALALARASLSWPPLPRRSEALRRLPPSGVLPRLPLRPSAGPRLPLLSAAPRPPLRFAALRPPGLVDGLRPRPIVEPRSLPPHDERRPLPRPGGAPRLRLPPRAAPPLPPLTSCRCFRCLAAGLLRCDAALFFFLCFSSRLSGRGNAPLLFFRGSSSRLLYGFSSSFLFRGLS